MLVAALAFFAASAAPAQTALPATATPAAPAAKPRRICRSEAVIGSITPKRVCTTVPASNVVPTEKSAQDQQPPAQQAPAPGRTGS